MVGVEVADFAGGFGGGESRRERFGKVNSIDITHLNIDWVGDSKDLNIKKSMDLNQVARTLTLWALGDSLRAIGCVKISPLAILNRTNYTVRPTSRAQHPNGTNLR